MDSTSFHKPKLLQYVLGQTGFVFDPSWEMRALKKCTVHGHLDPITVWITAS